MRRGKCPPLPFSDEDGNTHVWDSAEDPLSFYDEDGNIYISEQIKSINVLYADSIGYHETKEIEYKRSGQAHEQAHYSAYVLELEEVSKMLPRDALEQYIDWRLSLYPEHKIPERSKIVAQLMLLITRKPYPADHIRQKLQTLGL